MSQPRGRRQKKPTKKSLPAPLVQDFRKHLDQALDATDSEGRKVGDAKWGVYGFFDYDDEPIYVGQTNEQLRVRVRRHLTNQRTDAVAMRVLDVFEVAKLELWPLWSLQEVNNNSEPEIKRAASKLLDALEYSVYLKAIENSQYGAILNEMIPPISRPIELPESHQFDLLGDETRRERGHADTRLARRAETIARLAAVTHERGEVSDGLRRVLVVQAIRLTHLAARRLAYVEGRTLPSAEAIDTGALVGTVKYEPSDPTGHHDSERDDEP